MTVTPRMQPCIEFCSYPTPWGTMLLAAQEGTVRGLWFEGQAHFPDTSHWTFSSTNPVLQTASHQLQAYCCGNKTLFDLPINNAAGTPFQQQVWRSVARIPFGSTCSYQDIAHDIGKPKAVRAVANAIGRNRWIIVIPCHRVLGINGKLTGYAAGLERKSALLRFEKQT